MRKIGRRCVTCAERIDECRKSIMRRERSHKESTFRGRVQAARRIVLRAMIRIKYRVEMFFFPPLTCPALRIDIIAARSSPTSTEPFFLGLPISEETLDSYYVISIDHVESSRRCLVTKKYRCEPTAKIFLSFDIDGAAK